MNKIKEILKTVPIVKYLFVPVYTFGQKDKIYDFLENLSLMSGSGLTIDESMRSASEGLPEQVYMKIQKMADQISAGESVTDVFRRAGILEPHTLALLSAGEQSGQLNQMLHLIVQQNDKEKLFKSKLSSSVRYAGIVLSITMVVGIGTAWYTLPSISGFLKDSNVPLPLVTRIIIGIGSFFQSYGSVAVPSFLVTFGLLVYFLFFHTKTKWLGDEIMFRTPIVKKLVKQIEVSRFGYLLGTMLSSGVPLLDSIALLKNTASFSMYKSFYEDVFQSILHGKSFRQIFSSSPEIENLFPKSVHQMISAAERGGSLSQTLLKIGDIYQQKMDATARDIPTLIEPILLILVAIGVGVLALGTLMPIYQVMGTM